MKAILKTLFLLFVTAVCLTSDTATSSVPQASPAPELISVLLLARKQWPSAKILGVSELGLEVRDGRIVSSGHLCPSDAMNQIRRTLSDLP